MERSERSSLENCCICFQYMGDFKNELLVCTAYSERPIYEIFESLMNNKVKLTDDEIYNGGVCQNCFIKFNEFDEHSTLASRIQNEIMLLYETSSDIEYYPQKIDTDDVKILKIVKKEELEDISEVIIEGEGNEDIVSDYEQDELADINTSTEATLHEKNSKRKYKRKKNLDEGLIVVEVDGVKIYQCEICQKLCKDRYKLKAHREIHTTERRICCNECGAMFKTITCLYSHKKIHRERVYYYCDLCEMRYIQKTQLRKHIFAIHLKRKDYVCSICGKCYSRDTTLSKHMFVHNSERNVICNICGFATHTKPKLDRHMKSHTGERNYACKICGKKFLYSYNVTAHIRHVHYREKRKVDEEKLKCKFCGKKFQKIWKVKEHEAQVHSSEIAEAHLEEEEIIEGIRC